MDDNFRPSPTRESSEDLGLFPTFMEQVLDTVERVLQKAQDSAH